MVLPLTKNYINIDTFGFQVDVYKAIKLLNGRKEPLYLHLTTDRHEVIPPNGFCITDGIGETERAVLEFTDQETARRMYNFFVAAFSAEMVGKLQMDSRSPNWSRKLWLKTKTDEVVMKEVGETPVISSIITSEPPKQIIVPNNEIVVTGIERREKETFLKGVREALVSIIPLEELEKQRILKKYAGIPYAAELLLTDPSLMDRALHMLEKQGYTVTMLGSTLIASTNPAVINAIPHHQTIQDELYRCTSWFSRVKESFEDHRINASILSHPLHIVRSNYEHEIQIQAESLFAARLIVQFLEGNKIPCKKRGQMVYVTASKIIVKKQLVKVLLKREGFEKQKGNDSFVQSTYDYEMMHFLPFNRDRDEKHIEWIAQSMDEFGVIDIIKVAYTDCVDGEWKYWIVDGQHTYSAAKKRNLPVWYVTIQVDSLEELVRLTAVLNNRRKLWKFKDYLKAWSEINVPVYRKIADWVTKKLSATVIIEAISGKNRRGAMPLFQDGVFEEDTSLNSDQILNYMLVLKPWLPKSQTVSSAILRFMWTEKNYDNLRMKKVLENSKAKGDILFEAGETIQEVVKNIKGFYDKQAAY